MKIDDYSFRGLGQEAVDFKDQVTLLLNNGKYSSQVVKTPPAWTARNGESVFYLDSSNNIRRIYFYNNNEWNFIEYNSAGSTVIKAWVSFFASPAGPTIHDSYGVTSVTRNGAGDYTVTWGSAFVNTSYIVTFSAARSGGTTDVTNPIAFALSTRLIGSIRFTANRATNEVAVDCDPCLVSAIGKV